MFSGNTNNAGHGCRSSDRSYLFLLTGALTLELDWLEIGLGAWQRQLLLDCFGALLRSLETLVTCLICTPGRTHHRIRSPRLIASSY